MDLVVKHIDSENFNKKHKILEEVKDFIKKEVDIEPVKISFRGKTIVIVAKNNYEAIIIRSIIYRPPTKDYKLKVSV